MIRARPREVWSSLVRVVAALPASLEKPAYFRALAQWIEENESALGPEVVGQYGLDWLSELNTDNYPIRLSDFVVADEIGNLIRQHPSRMNTIGMFVRDQLWQLATFETGHPCPNCSEDELRALVDTAAPGDMIFACDFCGWAQNEDGARTNAKGTARPATMADLRARGLVA